MNFSCAGTGVFFLTLFLLVGCGVKSNPIPPKGTLLPSYVDSYSKQDHYSENHPEDNKDKKKQ